LEKNKLLVIFPISVLHALTLAAWWWFRIAGEMYVLQFFNVPEELSLLLVARMPFVKEGKQ